MDFLSLVVSIDKRRPIISTGITDVADLAPVSNGDNILGHITVVRETSDPTGPTEAFPLDSSGGVAITDGSGTVYANAVILQVAGNRIDFSIMVASADITAALEGLALEAALGATDKDYIEAFLEARGSYGGQDGLLMREPILINKAASSGGLGDIPATVVGLVVQPNITGRRGVGNTVENLNVGLAIDGFATGTFLLVSWEENGYIQKFMWQLLAGVADPLDLDGQVQSTDPARYWLAIGG